MLERILIVEDERITAEHLHDVLSDLGYEIAGLATSGAEAIAIAEQKHPALAIMDIHIKGDMDGTETARILRDRFDIPVVYLTAHADRETLGRAKRAEPLGYLVKPFQETELQASIEIALHKHRSDRRSRAHRDLLTSALEALGQGIISLDKDGTVTLLNPAAEAWTGWTQAEAKGKSVHDVFSLMDGDTSQPAHFAITAMLERAKSGIQELGSGLLLLPKSRGGRSISGTIAPILDAEGKAAGAVIVFGAAPETATASSPLPVAPVESDTIPFGRFKMIATSPVMKRVARFARRVAESEASTVLIEGESGTGKDVMAQFVHHAGKRQSGPFVALNCAALPDTLLESELFGYEKGAFTDARAQKRGLLETADGGTIFLDEIGEMPLILQAKMLRVLEEQVFRRLGGLNDLHVDLRVVAATNRRLSSAVRAGTFRLDLYYRLNVIQITIPSLRDRKEDVLPLAQHFLGMYNEKFKGQIRGFSSSAVRHLLDHDWPGNVRELRNTIERAVLLEESDWIEAASLQTHRDDLDSAAEPREAAPSLMAVAQEAAAGGGEMNLRQAEVTMIQQALKQAGGNQTKAAALLGVTRDVLRYRMKKFNLLAD